MYNDIHEILLTEEEISEKVKYLGEQISQDYNKNDEIVVVGVLKGASVFMADLIRQINIPVYIDFIAYLDLF